MVCLSSKDEFQCKSDECIKWTYVCDGISHCSNKADEDCDMCTNDLYICKDSSRINCTLACSTLGYIPCKNYADRKICASYNKKTSLFNKYGSFDIGERSSFLKGIPSNEKFMLTAVGLFVIAFLIISFLLFGLIYKRYKQKKKRDFTTRLVNNHQEENVNSNENINANTKINPLNQISLSKSNSNNSINSRDRIYISNSNNLIFGDKNPNNFNESNNNNKYILKLTKSNDLLMTKDQPDTTKIIDVHLNSSELKDSDVNDYQMYGEPPPSYKQSQFYPKANLKKIKNKNSEITTEPLLKVSDNNESLEDTSSHIYENIDELNTSNDSQKKLAHHGNNSRCSVGNKRAKFQTLKKNSLSGSMKLINRKQNVSTDSNNHSDLDISTISPSTISTSSNSTLNNQKFQKSKKQGISSINEQIL
ncbi:unnamed protein product [Brachionus calyciflorus]|uniref:Uncharacterized protein n=1 Tax=Brachionus calyciflorus TaxID=104777 RepID=A0A813SCC5_9BILA|nr:unnamed protein product [Brachionus calyciflorus]